MANLEIKVYPNEHKYIDNDGNVYDIGQLSDGYHTFNELYEHRFLLFLSFIKSLQLIYNLKVIKSLYHNDGSFYEGWFIVVLYLPITKEQISYHLPLKYWEYIDAQEKSRAEWDGHLSEDVLERLKRWLKKIKIEKL